MNPTRRASTSAEEILIDTTASEWLKAALESALARDPVDALNDALVLAATLEERLRSALGLSEPS
jgi:hypothetical protein